MILSMLLGSSYCRHVLANALPGPRDDTECLGSSKSCDVLPSGLPSNGTIAAEVAFMFSEWYKPNAKLEFPKGGSQGIINALCRSACPCSLVSNL